jgi:hypothetical protein
MTSWQEALKTAESTGGSFIRLGDGQSVTMCISGEPLYRRVHWVDKRPWLCAGNDCALCADGEKVQKKYAMHAYDVNAEEWKVLELGPRGFQEVAENWEDFPKHQINLKRTGAGMNDTRYRARLGEKISDELKKKMAAAKKLDLKTLLLDSIDTADKKDGNGKQAGRARKSGPAYDEEQPPDSTPF